MYATASVATTAGSREAVSRKLAAAVPSQGSTMTVLHGRGLHHVLTALQEGINVVMGMPSLHGQQLRCWHASQSAALLLGTWQDLKTGGQSTCPRQMGQQRIAKAKARVGPLPSAMLPTATPQQQSFAGGQQQSCGYSVAPDADTEWQGCRRADSAMLQLHNLTGSAMPGESDCLPCSELPLASPVAPWRTGTRSGADGSGSHHG